MSDQLSLFGVGAPARTDRLFFALFPPAAVAAHISTLREQLVAEHGLRGRPVPSERLHVTLHHVDDYAGLPPDVVRGAMKAGDALASHVCPVQFDEIGCFASNARKPILVLRAQQGIPAVERLQHVLASALWRHLPKVKVPASYTPHVSMFYGDPAYGDMSHVGQTISPIRWVASEVVLVHSLLGQSRHIPLARWQLSESTVPVAEVAEQ